MSKQVVISPAHGEADRGRLRAPVAEGHCRGEHGEADRGLSKPAVAGQRPAGL